MVEDDGKKPPADPPVAEKKLVRPELSQPVIRTRKEESSVTHDEKPKSKGEKDKKQ